VVTDDPDARRQRILATVDCVPAGRVATYGLVAREAGLPRHARFVGRVLRDLGPAQDLPWWRVIRSDGRLPACSAPAEQRRRLRAEGVAVDADGRVRLADYLWKPDA
jgi:methylated-DNA-protein-cysteine methyltransferase-like protein